MALVAPLGNVHSRRRSDQTSIQSTDPLPSPSSNRIPRRIGPVGATLSLLFIGVATLTPTGGAAPSVGSLCLGCGEFGTTDVVLNILLFAPLGLVLGRAGIRPLIIMGVGLFLSGGIEALQFLLPGRAPTLRDVLTNSLGCGLGGLVAIHLHGWLAPGRRALVLLWSAVIGLLVAIGLTGSLLRFDPPAGIYFGQWVQEQGHLEQWSGTVREAYVSGIAVPEGPSSSSSSLRTSLMDSAHFRMVGTAGAATRRLGGIFGLLTDAREEALLVGPDGDDLVVRVRRRTAIWRLRAPEFRFRDALRAVEPGAALAIEFHGTPQGGCALVNDVQHCVGRVAAGSTWKLARPFDGLPPLAQRLLDALTLFILALPFGLLLRSAPRGQALAATTVSLVGFPAVAWWSGLALPAPGEWLGLVCAIVIGAVLNARRRAPGSA